MDWLLEVQLSSLVLESHGVQSQAHISLTPSSSSLPSGPRSEVVVWELEADSSRFSFEQSFSPFFSLGTFSLIMIRDIIQLDFTIFILLIPVELVWLVFGEQKKLVILLNINEN